MQVSSRLFSVWPDDRYARPSWEPPLPTPDERVRARKELAQVLYCSESLRPSWVVKNFDWIRERKSSRRPDLAVDPLGILYVPVDLAGTIFEDRRSIELLPILVDDENWLAVHALGTTEGTIDARTSEVSGTTVPGQRVYRWVNLVAPKASIDDFVRLPQSVYGPLASGRFVDRVNGLGLKGLRFEPVGYVVSDASHAVPKGSHFEAVEGQEHVSERIITASLDPDELAAFLAEGAATRRALSLSDTASTSRILGVLTTALRQLGHHRSDRLDSAAEERLLGISAAYGDLICHTHHWTWVELRHGDGARWIGVKSPEDTHVLALLPYMKKQMRLAAPSLLLLFNMIGAGNLPSGAKEQVISIG